MESKLYRFCSLPSYIWVQNYKYDAIFANLRIIYSKNVGNWVREIIFTKITLSPCSLEAKDATADTTYDVR